jgi:hypothetical protein
LGGFLIFKNKKKGQVGIEFMLVTAVAFFTLITFLLILFQIMSIKQEEKVIIMAEDFILSIKQEIDFASNSEPGFSRVIDIPQKLEGFDYELILYSTEANTSYVELTVLDAFFVHVIPYTRGSLEPGKLKLSRMEHFVFLEVLD